MSKVPPEIDRLMWAVAERPTPAAMDEFGDRYPEFRNELVKRIEMVRGLRNEVKAPGKALRPVPKFNPPPPTPSAPPQGLYAAMLLGAAAVAFGAYTAFQVLKPNPVAPSPAPVVSLNQDLNEPKITYQNAPHLDAPSGEIRVPRPDPILPAPHPQIATAEQKRDLVLKDIQLLDALSLLTAGTDLKLELGSGFVDQKVSIAFHNRSTKEMLMELGKTYAFTVADEGNDRFHLEPVPDLDTQPLSPDATAQKGDELAHTSTDQ